MIKRMKHIEHGFTHVYDAGQEAQIRVHGWIEESESFPGEKPVADPVADVPVTVTEEKKKPGRRPRNR